MNEIARSVLIGAVSGLIAFAAAVLYLGGGDSEPSEPSLTRADVQAIIDSQPYPDQRAFRALSAAIRFAHCADWAMTSYHRDLWHRNIDDDHLEADFNACRDEAEEHFRESGTP